MQVGLVDILMMGAGITGDCKNINAEEVELIENHKFEEIKTLFWRNSNLNFNSPTD